MRRIVCYILIFLVLLQSSTRLFLVASYQWNKSYIAQTLCENKAKGMLSCQGKCYLDKQLKKEHQREHSTKNSLKEKYEFFLYDTFELPQRAVAILTGCSFYPYKTRLQKHFLTDIFHPPC